MVGNTGKQPLVLFLGAGASVALGVPSTQKLTTSVRSALAEITKSHNTGLLRPLRLPGVANQAELLSGALQQLYGSNFNFEHILHALETLGGLDRTWNGRAAERYRVVEAVLTSGRRGDLEACFDPCWIQVARDELYRCLYENVDTASQSAGNHADWALVRDFLQRLDREFDLFAATLNYDLTAETALGWDAHCQGFEPIPSEDVWRFWGHATAPHLLHLHGSIQFGYRNGDPNRFIFEDEFEDLYWHSSPNTALQTWFGKSNPTSQAGRDTVAGPLITGLQKPDKLLAEPYLSYFRHFQRLIATTPRILIAGYGFSDVHINAVLSRLTKWHAEQRRIAVLGFTPEDEWLPSMACDRDMWHGFFPLIARWAEDPCPMNSLSYPDPWAPSGPGANCVRVYLRGLCETLKRHEQGIVDFLHQ